MGPYLHGVFPVPGNVTWAVLRTKNLFKNQSYFSVSMCNCAVQLECLKPAAIQVHLRKKKET